MKEKYVVKKHIGEDNLWITVASCDTLDDAVAFLEKQNFAEHHILKRVTEEVIFHSGDYYGTKEIREALRKIYETN